MATSLATLVRSARPQHACNLNRNGASRPWLVLLFCPSSFLCPPSSVLLSPSSNVHRPTYVKCNFFFLFLNFFCVWPFVLCLSSSLLSPRLALLIWQLSAAFGCQLANTNSAPRTLRSALYPDTFSHFPFPFPFDFDFHFHFHFHSSKLALGASGS